MITGSVSLDPLLDEVGEDRGILGVEGLQLFEKEREVRGRAGGGGDARFHIIDHDGGPACLDGVGLGGGSHGNGQGVELVGKEGGGINLHPKLGPGLHEGFDCAWFCYLREVHSRAL